jgi:hypothetical protein
VNRTEIMSSRAIRSAIRIARIIYVLASLSATILWASVGGSISGIVKDPSGSVVAKAHVIVKETNTELSYETHTDNNGYYTFPVLPVGHYVVDIAASGFRGYERRAIVLDTTAALKFDASLEVGNVSQGVTVTDNTLHVETTSAQMGRSSQDARSLRFLLMAGATRTFCLCSRASLPRPPSAAARSRT